MKVVLRCENDVCTGALFVNFTVRYFVLVCLHFAVACHAVVIIQSHFIVWLIINGTVVIEGERKRKREERQKIW